MAREAKHKKDDEKKAEGTEQPILNESPVTAEEQPTAVSEQTTEAGAVNEIPSEEAVSSADGTPSDAEAASIQAKTHARNRTFKKTKAIKSKIIPAQKKWQTLLGLGVGALALLALVVSGISSQYFKGKTMPNVSVAGISSTAKTPEQIKQQLEAQEEQLKISFYSGEKKFEPKLEEIGLDIDIGQTVENALQAKRDDGILAKIAFWKRADVPVITTVNNTLLSQYIETNLPELLKAPQDSQLQFSPQQNRFVITPQADGEGADMSRIKKQLLELGNKLENKSIEVRVATKKPAITEGKLQPLLGPANELVARRAALTGLGYRYLARPADIAEWITPTPQKDGSIKLVVDSSKVQSYVDSIGKRIAHPPVDRKVIKDANTGGEIVLQEGRDGTELANSQALAGAIVRALEAGRDSEQIMNIKVATHKTVNMEAYDRWIEVDLSEQRTTLYTGATPIHTFVISSGLARTPTVTGEFKVWHKNAVQTMSGGSRATGDYYDLPNVKWNTYFYKDYALHTAYWHNNFGQPMSHGCVNMREADAKIVYDFAPIGTTVIVHD